MSRTSWGNRGGLARESTGIDQVNVAISQMDGVTQQNAARGAGRRGHAQHVGPGARSARIHVGLPQRSSVPARAALDTPAACRHTSAAAAYPRSSAILGDRSPRDSTAPASGRPAGRSAPRSAGRRSPARCPRPRPFGDPPRPGDRQRQSMQQAQPHALGAQRPSRPSPPGTPPAHGRAAPPRRPAGAAAPPDPAGRAVRISMPTWLAVSAARTPPLSLRPNPAVPGR